MVFSKTTKNKSKIGIQQQSCSKTGKKKKKKISFFFLRNQRERQEFRNFLC